MYELKPGDLDLVAYVIYISSMIIWTSRCLCMTEFTLILCFQPIWTVIIESPRPPKKKAKIKKMKKIF